MCAKPLPDRRIAKGFRDGSVKCLNDRLRRITLDEGRGRDTGYPMPPAQIRTCSITAYGSCLRS